MFTRVPLTVFVVVVCVCQPMSGLTVQVVAIRAKSKGRVSLRSADPMDTPKVECK
jgi:hypothetical protein